MDSAERTVVLARLDALRDDYLTAERVYEYVASERDADVAVGDLLTTLRLDESLALELRDSGGRTVIAAHTDDQGVTMYAVWEYSALAGDSMDAWQYRRVVEPTLKSRRPWVRLRSETDLSDIDAPEEFRADKGRREEATEP